MDNKRFHLQMIQAVVTRMGGASFLLKGWCVTLVSALIALSWKDPRGDFTYVAALPILMFWILDAYFVSQERLFRKLYDKVRCLEEANIDFSMDTLPLKTDDTAWTAAAVSKTLFLFYGLLMVAVALLPGRMSG